MAKSSSFFGMRKGSTKSHTYSVLKGQQVTKDRVFEVANPKTPAQMIQRMNFANAVKFFKHGQAGFFKFAFEDKKAKESDYNAFMRHNAKNAVAVSYPDYKESAYPAFGRYILTQGSLPSPVFAWGNDSVNVRLTIPEIDVDQPTIGLLSSALLTQYPSLLGGDIVTILIVHTSLKNDGTMTDERINRWEIRQFNLDIADSRNCAEVLGIELTDEGYADIMNIDGSTFDKTVAKGAAVVFSRNTPNGLKCSTSEIIPNDVANAKMTAMSTPVAIDAAATTWGATDPAILQGALVK